MSDFRSGCRRQISLVITPPHKEIAARQGRKFRLVLGNKKISRRMPYPPNFRRIPARIIDPATGASTWALGSHRWVRNIGIFTRNARMVAIHQMFSMKGAKQGVVILRNRDRWPYRL